MRQPLCGLVLLWGGLMTVSWTAGAVEPGAVEPEALIVERADPALRRFVQAVVDANPRVQAARAELAASGARRDAASRPIYNPELSLDAEDADTETRALGISQTFDWGGKRGARTAVAEADRLVKEAQYLASRRAVTAELLAGLARHRTSLARDELAAARRRLMDQFTALAERRFDAGDLNQVELDLARLAATDARIRKATAGAALAEARQAVRNLAPPVPVAQWPPLPGAVPALPRGADPRTLVLTLPEVLAAQRQVETADALVELRRRERRPDPTVSLTGGEEEGESLIGLSVSIPLFVRNRFDDEVAAALAGRSKARQNADDVLLRARARLVSATERYDLARSAWIDWKSTGEESLTRQTRQLRKLWEAGELGTTDYLVQLTATLDVQERALALREALWRAWFEWLGASGQVEAWLGTTR